MDISSLIGNPIVWVIVAFILIAILYALKSYFTVLMSSLFYDYVVDFGLSFADNFVYGSGLAGLDIGDWLAGIIIFFRYRKQAGTGWALLFAAEAANFGLSFIPGIGEPLEWLFNVLPIISIVMLYKQSKAQATYSRVLEPYNYLKEENPDAADQWKGAVDKIKQYYDSLDYQNLANEGQGIAEGLLAEVGKSIMKKLNTAQQYVIDYLEEEAKKAQGLVNENDLENIKGAIQRAVQDIDTDWRLADTEANQILQSISSLVYQTQKNSTQEAA